MATPPVSGIVFNSDDDALARLPLEEVKINALVVDLSARVDVIQTFLNPSRTSTSRAKYMFPVPSGAAVCAFDMYSELSGRLIVGVAKEKVQAAQDHEQAIQEGKRTALVEWGSGDIFTISVGAIPARDRVRTTVTYVMDLLDGDVSHEIRLQIPMSVGQRYGEPPAGMRGAAAASTRTRVRIDANVQMRGKITHVASPSHPGIHATPYKSRTGERSQRRATVAFRSPDFLEQDFVLCIHAEKIDRPRCFAELDPLGSGTVAMQLALLPKFDLPPVPSQEFVFVVDRSGSMSGMRIETAKDTMAMLLRFLPGDGTTFNIFSFGSHCDSLWSRSALYSSGTMSEATYHIDGMDANYGGTEIRAALQQVCNSRDISRPTVVFILTDGESYDHDATAGVVAAAVAQSAPGSPLRVFALGIGSTASSEMCERIAHAGNGFARYATTAEDIVSKCATLFRAGRSFLHKDISIDWGLPPAKFQSASSVASANANAFAQQTPIHPDPLYAGHRYIVFALIRNKRYKIPKAVTLSAKRDGEPSVLTFTIPVEKVRFADKNAHRLIHTLAARRLISDLQNDVELAQMLSEEERKTHIVELGEKYQLASKYTSFVAVEDDGETPLPVPRPAWAKPPRRRNQISRSSQSARSPGVLGYVGSALSFGGIFVTEFLRMWFGPSQYAQSTQPSNPPDAGGGDEPDGGSDGDAYDNARNYDSDDTFSTLSSFFSYSDSSVTDSRPPTPLDENARSPSPDLDADPNSAGRPQGRRDDGQLFESSAPPLTADVKQLIRMQSPEGAFIIDDTFRQIVGLEAIEKRPSHVDDSLWATALAIAYCRKYLAQQPDILGILDEKAREWVEKYLQQAAVGGRVDFNALVLQASQALGTQ